jgi:hypothetical protein
MKRIDFKDLRTFAAACDQLPERIKNTRGDKSWSGETWTESICRASNGGSVDCVQYAQEFIDRIQASLPETATHRWALEHVGAFPCVPAFLSGEPENMWAPADMPTETAPIRIYASVCCSCSVDWEAMQRRGAAILALVLIVSRTRPVELYTYSDWAEHDDRGDTVLSIRLPSHPMMVSEVAWALTAPALMRNLGFAYLRHHVPTIGHSFPWGDASRADRHRAGPAQRKLLNLEPQDILIGPVYMGDPLTNDPVGFIQSELSKLNLI